MSFFVLSSIVPAFGSKDHNSKCYKHKIQLQLSDSLGFPVPDTQFWVTLDIIKEGPKVTIQLPAINFQTGQSADNPFEPPALFPGGYLYTSDGLLPEDIRPNELMYRSYLVPSNNGASTSFSFADPSTFTAPPVGYILQVTNAGALVVQCAGTFGNIIPPGPQILLPTDITYIVKPKRKLCENVQISTGFTDVTQFTYPAINDSLRDSHVTDAFDGVAAFAWSDNSTELDKTNNTLNLMVAIGEIDSCGKLKVRKPIQLTNTPGNPVLPANVMVWDTAIAINRTNKNNIVVSYGVLNFNTDTSLLYRAVSFDGGNTWPVNGPLNIQGVGGFGDARGVAADKHGNFWFSYTNRSDNTPVFAASNDGVTFTEVFVATPLSNPNEIYDYPQYCFGEDGQGNYGLHFVVDNFNLLTADAFIYVGFIPITNQGVFGGASFVPLPKIRNVVTNPNITASSDGRVWIQGIPTAFLTSSYIQPLDLMFKSPGPIDQNYAGAWQNIIYNGYNPDYSPPSLQVSQPFFGYIFASSVQSIIYDDKRQALYAVIAAPFPDTSQNMRIYFIISRDNGQTWSNPIDIATTSFANRGFQSMALDSKTGDLIFGWYDGRNDPTFKSVEYFGASISAKKLDKLVCQIPLSNPLYVVPSSAGAAPQLKAPKMDEKRAAAIRKYFENRFGDRFNKKLA